MNDLDEASESGSGTGRDANLAALAMALGQASALDPRAASFLQEQTEILRIQKTGLEEEQRLQLSHLRVRRWSDYARIALEAAAGLFFLALVGGLAAMVWNAMHDDSIVVDAFAVPPDMAARGLTGTVVAAELLDKFGQMQAATTATAQSGGSYRLDVGDNIRIAIPQTGGISIGDLDRYLRSWLGDQVHVSGEVVRTDNGINGITVTVRAGSAPGARADGAEADFDRLIEESAENLYAQTQPLRFGDYLADEGRYDEAIAILQPLSLSGSPMDRARALTSWAEALVFKGEFAKAVSIASDAVRLVPTAYFSYLVRADADISLGHDQAAFADEEAVIRYAPYVQSHEDQRSQALRNDPIFAAARLHRQSGDFRASIDDWNRFYAAGGFGPAEMDNAATLMERLPAVAAGHDLEAARQLIAATPQASSGSTPVWIGNGFVGFYAEDWKSVTEAASAPIRRDTFLYTYLRAVFLPFRAIAIARLGDLAGADAILSNTSLDCDACVRARGQVAALRHDWKAVDHWFGIVAARSPSIPFATTDWGAALLQKGDIGGAIAKFRAANTISPHFADPLEMWGEALMQKNRSDLALARFAEANKYAPKWGRLHLKWGEALGYAGRKDEARAQYRIASTLDLSVADKVKLARDMR